MSVADSVVQMAQLNNEWSAEQAQRQMDFQERMSNTAHQREMADLKAAGLNPVLSAKLGGASTPSGASASADTSYLSAFIEALKEFGEGAVSSAVEAAVSASGGSASSHSGSSRSVSSHPVNTGLDSLEAYNDPSATRKFTDFVVSLLPRNKQKVASALIASSAGSNLINRVSDLVASAKEERQAKNAVTSGNYSVRDGKIYIATNSSGGKGVILPVSTSQRIIAQAKKNGTYTPPKTGSHRSGSF